jgi:hypothetical protein
MRTLVFGAILLAVAAAGFHTLISSSLAAARDAKAATFSERFDPVLKPRLRKATGALTSAGERASSLSVR